MKSLKESPPAWNLAVETFKRAFILTSNADLSFRVAFDKVREDFPNLEYDESSFVGPMVDGLKKNEALEANYEFKVKPNFDDEFLARFEAKLEYQKLLKPIEEKARENVFREKANEIAEKMSGLNDDQKKKFAVKLAELMSKGNKPTEEQVKDIYCYALGLPSNIK